MTAPKRRWFTFSLRTMFLMVAAVAIWIGDTARNVTESPSLGRDFLAMLLYFSPTWLPLVFVAYAIGRREITAGLLVALAIAEGAALYGMTWATHL